MTIYNDVSVFLHSIFDPVVPAGLIELRVFYGLPSPKRTYHTSVDGALSALVDTDPEYDVYFGVAPRSNCRNSKGDVRRISCLWGDVGYAPVGRKGSMDCPSKEDSLTTIRRFPIRPSIIIDTGNEYQLYWLLETPLNIGSYAMRYAAEHYMRMMIRMLNSDRDHDLSGIERMPGTTCKRRGNLSATAAFVEMNPLIRHHIDSIDALLDPESTTESKDSIRRIVLGGLSLPPLPPLTSMMSASHTNRLSTINKEVRQ